MLWLARSEATATFLSASQPSPSASRGGVKALTLYAIRDVPYLELHMSGQLVQIGLDVCQRALENGGMSLACEAFQPPPIPTRHLLDLVEWAHNPLNVFDDAVSVEVCDYLVVSTKLEIHDSTFC